MKNSPLNDLKVASPCPANWDEMLGDNRKRFCGECQLNVYNLSDMNKTEAENFIMNSEGRVCVRFYKRADGTVITQDCPVGWAKVKRNLSLAATAVFSLIIGLFGGIFAFISVKKESQVVGKMVPVNTNVRVEEDKDYCPPTIMGNVSTMGTPVPQEVKGKPSVQQTPVRITRNRNL